MENRSDILGRSNNDLEKFHEIVKSASHYCVIDLDLKETSTIKIRGIVIKVIDFCELSWRNDIPFPISIFRLKKTNRVLEIVSKNHTTYLNRSHLQFKAEERSKGSSQATSNFKLHRETMNFINL